MVWISGVIWLVIVGGLAAAYAAGHIGAGTLVVAEVSVLIAGALAFQVWWNAAAPPDLMAEFLYKTEQPERIDRAA